MFLVKRTASQCFARSIIQTFKHFSFRAKQASWMTKRPVKTFHKRLVETAGHNRGQARRINLMRTLLPSPELTSRRFTSFCSCKILRRKNQPIQCNMWVGLGNRKRYSPRWRLSLSGLHCVHLRTALRRSYHVWLDPRLYRLATLALKIELYNLYPSNPWSYQNAKHRNNTLFTDFSVEI